MIKSRRKRWAGHEALKGIRGNACRILVGKPEESLEELDVGGMIVLK
jgi:hypothetical protein